MNGIERAIGRLEGRMDGVEKQTHAIFKEIKSVDERRQTDKKEILAAIAAHPPCSKVTTVETEMKDHKEQHSNTVRKATLLAVFASVIMQFLKELFFGHK